MNNPFKKLFQLARAFTDIVFNRYESAVHSADRSWIPSMMMDARHDANSYTRGELARKIDYFSKNVWLVQRLEEEYAKWTVGPNGLQIIPCSSDTGWNKRVAEAYAEWCESPCLDSTITMAQVHRQIARDTHIFGGLFINKTRRKEAGKASTPAIQLIATHRCGSPGTDFGLGAENNVIDGVELGLDAATGKPTKPVGYWIQDGLAGNEWVFRSTRDMHHVFDPVRIGMFREISPYYACMDPLHDLDDLEKMEMQKAKSNSEVASILTNPAGEINPNLARNNRYTMGATTPNPNPLEADVENRLSKYKRVLGSKMVALKTGEQLEQFDSKTPSAATQWYWQYKIGQVCAATNIPLILVFPELAQGIQGTVVRGVYDNAHEFFRSRSSVFAHAAREMYRFFINWARYNDPRCVDAPADWNKCHVIPPRAVNVDIGYNSASTLAELDAGITNLDDIAGRCGTTADVLIYKKANNIADIKIAAREVSKARGVEVLPEEISAPLADVIQKLGLAKQAEGIGEQAMANAEKVDDPAPKKEPANA